MSHTMPQDKDPFDDLSAAYSVRAEKSQLPPVVLALFVCTALVLRKVVPLLAAVVIETNKTRRIMMGDIERIAAEEGAGKSILYKPQ